MKDAPFRWEPKMVAGMTTGAIADKLRELSPVFSLDAFTAKTGDYISIEELADKEYYPAASFSDSDEDFIWMACDELWRRVAPDNPAVEHVIEEFDDLVHDAGEAEMKEEEEEALRLSREALSLVCRHSIMDTPDGSVVRREFFEKLGDESFYDFDDALGSLLRRLMEADAYEEAMDFAGRLGQAMENDDLLAHKAECLFGLSRKGEGEDLFHEIMSRHPRDPWFAIRAGDCFMDYGLDRATARGCYLQALRIAEKRRKKPGGKEELGAACGRLMRLAEDDGDHARVTRYRTLLGELEAEMKAPCPCGSGRKYKKCCGRAIGYRA